MTDTTTTSATASPDSSAGPDGANPDAAAAATGEAQTQQSLLGTPDADADTTADAPAEGEAAKTEDEADEPAGAPEAYEDFVVPDGVVLNTEVLEEFKAIGKELNLPQEAAQKVADLGVKLSQQWAQAQADNVVQLRKEWVATVTNDPEIGGDKLAENLAIAKKAIATFGGEGLNTLLNDYGFGDNPDFVRFALNVGKAISEDGLVTATGEPKAAPKSTANVFFPDAN